MTECKIVKKQIKEPAAPLEKIWVDNPLSYCGGGQAGYSNDYVMRLMSGHEL